MAVFDSIFDLLLELTVGRLLRKASEHRARQLGWK